MSEAQTQEIDERYENHSVTNGEFARYLEAENPNCPVDDLPERFEIWKAGHQLPRIRTNWSCPECGSSDVFYTEEPSVARCDSCGLQIMETDKSADEFLNGGSE